MNRRFLLAGAGATALLAMTSCPVPAGMPIPHAELKRCWQVAELADTAADMIRNAPASWGGLPWSFEGPVQFHNPERLETVRVRIVAVRDFSDERGRGIQVDYAVLEPVRQRRIGQRTFYKSGEIFEYRGRRGL